jgi:hypothetical protein
VNKRVTVTVNGRPVTLFLGLAVRHAIGPDAVRDVQLGLAEVRDGYGNMVGLDGALYDGEVLVVHPVQPPSASAEQIDRRRRWAEERLLDDESLRSELTDDEAQVLLDWGLSRAKAQVDATQTIADDEEARTSLREALRPLSIIMRNINHFVGGRDRDTPTTSRDVEDLFAEVGPQSLPPAVRNACRVLAGEQTSLDNVALLRRLIAIADQLLQSAQQAKRTEGEHHAPQT